MNREAARIWTARLLLGFVVFTLGFAAGRQTASRPPAADVTEALPPDAFQVVVYAAHMTFRCPECNQIEWLARELIETEFAVELASGLLAFRSVDYLRDPAFARRYDISSSTLVIVRTENGVEQDFQRLDDVWVKVRDREEYFAYVRAAIRASLGPEYGG